MNLFKFLEDEPIYTKQKIKFEFIENNLIYLYNNPKRAYHNLNHVKDCLQEFDDYYKDKTYLTNDAIKIIKFALIYHDCIYDPKNTNNEELSAQRAFIDLSSIEFDSLNTKLVYKAIIATKHIETTRNHYPELICDIDLSILGKDFLLYDQQIEEEYSFLSKNEYIPKRIEFLKNLLNKESIYHTEHFKNKYEQSARNNIQNRITVLTEIHKVQNEFRTILNFPETKKCVDPKNLGIFPMTFRPKN